MCLSAVSLAVTMQQTQGDPFAAFIRVVKQAGINNSKQGNGDKAETNQIQARGRGRQRESESSETVQGQGRQRRVSNDKQSTGQTQESRLRRIMLRNAV